MIKKLLLSLVVFAVLFSSVGSIMSSSVKAEWYDQSVSSWYNRVYTDPPQEIFGERYTAAQVEWIIYSLITWPFSKILQPELTACLFNALPFAGGVGGDLTNCSSSEAVSVFMSGLGSAFNTLFSTASGVVSEKETTPTLATFFNPQYEPSGIGYFREKLSNIHVVSPAMAQEGFGYSRLGGLFQDLWRASRNIAYSLMILVIIVMAMMIMLRTKVSQQSVATIQWAIPKIATTLIYITFSYSIAGLLIDLMYVFIGIISLVLVQFFSAGIALPDMFNAMTQGPLSLGIFGYLIIAFIGYPVAIFFSLIGAGTNFGGDILSLFLGGGLGVILAVLLVVIMFFAVFIVWFKVTMLILKTTATIYVLLVTAPLQIMLGPVVPSMGFGKWVRSFISNLVVFPVVGVLFTFSFALLGLAITTSAASLPFGLGDLLNINPPLSNGNIGIGDGWPPLLGFSGELGALILVLISFTLFSMTRKAGDLAKGLVAGKLPAFDSAIAETVAPASMAAGVYGAPGQAYRDAVSKQMIENAVTNQGLSSKERAAMWTMEAKKRLTSGFMK